MGVAGVAESSGNKANLNQPAKLELGLGLSLAIIDNISSGPAYEKHSTQVCVCFSEADTTCSTDKNYNHCYH